MLITNAIKHVKPYITMYVGRAKFIHCNKHNILVIIVDDGVALYKNGKLLGLIIETGIYTEVLSDDGRYYCSQGVMWDNCTFCGWVLDTAHNIPFYSVHDRLSIFGFSVIQFRRDSFKRTLAAKALYEKVTQN